MDAVILVIPLLLSVTLFALSPGYLLILTLLPTLVLLLVPPREAGTPLPSARAGSRHSSRRSSPVRTADTSSVVHSSQAQPDSAIPPLSALTTYRAHMLLLTAICILAVDFPVFPRDLAKCETFGASLVRLCHDAVSHR